MEDHCKLCAKRLVQAKSRFLTTKTHIFHYLATMAIRATPLISQFRSSEKASPPTLPGTARYVTASCIYFSRKREKKVILVHKHYEHVDLQQFSSVSSDSSPQSGSPSQSFVTLIHWLPPVQLNSSSLQVAIENKNKKTSGSELVW